jgi:hypothetical protein
MSQALAKLEASIEAQQKKLAQLKAHKQKIEARQKAKLQGVARQQNTRRKILAGVPDARGRPKAVRARRRHEQDSGVAAGGARRNGFAGLRSSHRQAVRSPAGPAPTGKVTRPLDG